MSEVINFVFGDSSRSVNRYTEDEQIVMAYFFQNGKEMGIFTNVEEDHGEFSSAVKFYGDLNGRSEPLVSITKTDARKMSSDADESQKPYALKMLILEEDGGFSMESNRSFASFEPVYQLVNEAIKLRLGMDIETETGTNSSQPVEKTENGFISVRIEGAQNDNDPGAPFTPSY